MRKGRVSSVTEAAPSFFRESSLTLSFDDAARSIIAPVALARYSFLLVSPTKRLSKVLTQQSKAKERCRKGDPVGESEEEKPR